MDHGENSNLSLGLPARRPGNRSLGLLARRPGNLSLGLLARRPGNLSLGLPARRPGNLSLGLPARRPGNLSVGIPGRIRVHGIGGGHKQLYRMIDFHRLKYEPGKDNIPFQEKVVEVRYDPCRSADIALVAGGKRKRWIIATENMKAGDLISTSGHIGRMAVSAQEGDAHPLGALPVGTLINSLEVLPGKGAQVIRAAGTCGVLLRKVNGTAIVQLPSKRQIQVLETCIATVGRVSNVDHNKRILGSAGASRWLGIRPSSGLWHRKGGWAGRKIRPLPALKSYVKLPSATAAPRA
uniref:Large ribosomal subunit protein uL2m n=1 Tax=Leptobrachium leishanense TaxID=445787 RepID=A0A8C5WJC9_9ANUR